MKKYILPRNNLIDNKKLREIFKSIAKGKSSALREFFDLYKQTIYIIAKSYCNNHEDADEVVNEVLIKVWNLSDTVCDNPGGWLYRTIRNTALDKLKNTQKRWLPLEDNVQDNHDYYNAINGELVFSYCLRDLSELEHTVMVCKFINDMTFENIAKLLNKPIGSITAIYYRTLQKIKEKLEKF